jgi:ribosomal protein L11 methyltransferase
LETEVAGGDITVVSAEVAAHQVEAISDALAEAGVMACTWEDREGGPCRVEIFLEDAEGAPGAADAIRAACAAVGADVSPSVGTIRREDWAESWKRFFKVERVSPRIVVRPPWEAYEPADGECVITLDPGMSFGTGRHATTRTCLAMIDELAADNPERDFLDIGCGSGILSVAAAKLGFEPVTGIDIDEDAVRIAAENAAANGVEAEFFAEDLSKCRREARVVVANVLAPVLIEYARQVACCVEDAGREASLVLSGILDTQYAAVKAAYEAQGFFERKSVLDGEWRTGLFVH